MTNTGNRASSSLNLGDVRSLERDGGKGSSRREAVCDSMEYWRTRTVSSQPSEGDAAKNDNHRTPCKKNTVEHSCTTAPKPYGPNEGNFA